MENKDITTFDEHLDQQYGITGSAKRTQFELKQRHLLLGS
jgi:hypothetical protein